ncbi:two-component system sensor histidine kinase NtrB [Rhodopila sp.]|uniref:two-component system sensor histidine kinase NtrB n=1 Tax=Rhodopila sp. TaxID=2480087 RepID=UPI003D0A2890
MVDMHNVRHTNEMPEQRVQARTAELEAANRRLTAEIAQRRRTEDALRARETHYRMLYNHAPIALHSVNADALLLEVNDTWVAMFGYPREAVIGRSPADFMTAESAERYQGRAWPEMLASRGQVCVMDYQFVTRDGQVFDGRLAARGDFDAAGRFNRSSAAIADITAEKRAERDLRRAHRLEAVGQLTAGVAHDFNNLLTAILGNLELLMKRPATDRLRTARLVAGARAAAERGAKLTAQLLAFSRQQRITAGPVDLNQVIRGMLPLLRRKLGGAVGIKLAPAPDLWAALADRTQMELAVLNLAINARDAMPCGGTITIATAHVARGEPAWPEEPAAGHYVSLSVSDTGSGMAEAVRDRMFEPFFTTKAVGMGAGLGLSQVLGVVKQLHGGLTVRSVLDQGTCISIFLPRADAAAKIA